MFHNIFHDNHFLLEDSIEEIWNGKRAQELRKQIFNGEWNYCQASFCPWIQGDLLPNIKDVLDKKV